MSIYSKFLWPIIVPAGGWDFGFDDAEDSRVATIAEGTYATILEVGAALRDAMEGVSSVGFEVNVSPVGTLSISGDDYWVRDWLATDDALSAVLGFVEPEDAIDYVLTATNQHLAGYYPGLLTFGRSTANGVGITTASEWVPDWPMVRQLAGNNQMALVGPSTPSYSRTLDFGLIGRTEYQDQAIGLLGFWNNCIAQEFRFYEDRALGTVAAPGAQGTDYELCTLMEEGVRLSPAASGRRYYSFSLRLNREPSP